MTEYLLDTNHLSYLQERHPRVLDRLRLLQPKDRLMTSVVSAGELLRGVYMLPTGRRQYHLLEMYHDVLRQMAEILPITLDVAEAFAEIDVSLRRRGKPIPVNDVWIAAAAISRSAVLVTNDEHFAAVPGLRADNWTQ